MLIKGMWLQATFTSATTLTMENVSATAQFYGKGMCEKFAVHVMSVVSSRESAGYRNVRKTSWCPSMF